MSADFERNLERLLKRAYVAVRPGDECRARLEAAVLAAMDQTQAERRAAPPRARPVAPPTARRAAPFPWLRPALAAAALLLAVGALWWLGRGPAADGLERLLADGRVAWRAAPADAWAALPDEERATHTAGWREFATPGPRGVEVDVSREGGLALSPSSQASLLRLPGEPLRIELSRGAIDVRRDADSGEGVGAVGEWLITAGDRVVHLETGALSVALAADAAGGVSVLLWSGRAWLETPDGRQTLSPGRAVADGADAGGLPRWNDRERPAELLVPGELAGGDAVAQPAPGDLPLQPDPEEVSPTSLRGRVLDRGTALPLSAYTLTLVLEDVTARGPSEETRSISAQDGRFEWSDIEPGSYALFAQATGYATASRRGLAIDGSRALPALELGLEPGGSQISGRVVEAATGAPLAGAIVLSESDAPVRMLALDAAEIPASLTARTITQPDGSFELTGLASGPQVLRATANGFAPEWIRVDVTGEPRREGIELRLAAPAAVQGRVTLDNGAPAAGMFMLVSLGDHWPQRACIAMRYGVTDDQGQYSIGDLPAEEAVVLMLGPSEQLDAPTAPPRVLPVLLKAGQTVTVDFDGEPRAGRLHGVIVDAAGVPANGLILSLTAADATAEQAQTEWLGAMTDEQGAYEFRDLGKGRYELFLVEGAGASVVRCGSIEFLGGGDQRHDLQLPGATIAGSLRDGRSGAPLPNGIVVVLANAPGRDREFAARVQVGADGRFDCGPLPAGIYRVQGHASDEGWGEALAEIELPAESTGVAVDLDLFPGGSLDVLAVDENGTPLPGASIELINAAGLDVDFAEHQVTNGTGAFRLDGLSVGSWTVRVTLAGRRAEAHRVEVRAGEPASVRVALQPLP